MTETPGPTAEVEQGHPHRARRHRSLAAVAAAGLAVAVGGAALHGGTTHLVTTSTATTATTSTLAEPAGLAAGSGTVAGSVKDALVDVVSTEKYQGSVSAGTGMILSSTGEILTNNHVIDGATSIRVTVVATGRTYTASVVGTDPTDDVAVIQLKGATGLGTIPIGDAASVQVGQKVKAIGNAGGTGGTPSTVTGTVTALDRSITASDESGSNAEQLSGLIETDAPIVPGDSGGALATTGGEVIGMNTAAAATDTATSGSAAAGEGYAIPIQSALSVANQIESGQASSTIHIGTHGFLGIVLPATGSTAPGRGGWGQQYGVASGAAGATVAGVTDGSAAATAGLTAGDTITSLDGTAVDSASTLNTGLAATAAGQKVTLGWTDAYGNDHTATVSLDAAPAD